MLSIRFFQPVKVHIASIIENRNLFTKIHSIPKKLDQNSAIWKRYLLTTKPPKPEVVAGNMAAIFGTLAVMEHTGRDAHPDVTIICPRFWMDYVHPSYFKEPWGQIKHSLPKVVRDIFNQLYPDYPDQEFLNWGQVQELRKEALKRLEDDYQIPIFHGDPSIKKLTNNNFEITITCRDKKGKFYNLLPIYRPENTQFYLWYHVPREHKLDNISQMPSYELYSFSASELFATPDYPNIVAFGAGLSTQWLAKFFATPNTTCNIICIVDNPGQVYKIIPANASIDLNRVIILNKSEVTIYFNNANPNLIQVDSHKLNKTFKGVACAAIGMITPDYIAKDIPVEQLITPTQWKSKEWIAPENEAQGSLKYSLFLWYIMTQNLWALEIFGFEKGPYHMAQTIRAHCRPELEIPTHFDTAVELAIKQLHNTPPEKDHHEFLINIYIQSCQPSLTDIEKFKIALQHAFPIYTTPTIPYKIQTEEKKYPSFTT